MILRCWDLPCLSPLTLKVLPNHHCIRFFPFLCLLRMIKALSELPKGAVKTITCDRGSEFSEWRRIEKELDCNMYFTDPYCAWQKGTNENLNGLLREFYPKGRNLSRVSPQTLKKNLALINARPKKVLGFQKPVDLFNASIQKLLHFTWQFIMRHCAWYYR